jgi:hypothetical protein
LNYRLGPRRKIHLYLTNASSCMFLHASDYVRLGKGPIAS